jgi:hypothetical protein
VVRPDIVRPPWPPLALPPAPLPPVALPPVPATGVRGEAGAGDWGAVPFDPARAASDGWVKNEVAAEVAEAAATAEVTVAARAG